MSQSNIRPINVLTCKETLKSYIISLNRHKFKFIMFTAQSEKVLMKYVFHGRVLREMPRFEGLLLLPKIICLFREDSEDYTVVI